MAAAFVNIKIPMMLGELTNIVNMFTTNGMAIGVTSFIAEIKEPAIKLLCIYAAQVISILASLTFKCVLSP